MPETLQQHRKQYIQTILYLTLCQTHYAITRDLTMNQNPYFVEFK